MRWNGFQMAGAKEPIKIRERDGKLILTLDGKGWDPANGELLKLMFNWRAGGRSSAEFLAEAIRLQAERYFPGEADKLIQAAREDVARNLKRGRNPYGGRMPRPAGPKPGESQ